MHRVALALIPNACFVLCLVLLGEKNYVTIAGLSNSYASYVVTYEEYQAQRYEAASTIFGPHTLDAYIQEFSRLARDMVAGRESTTDAPPPDLTDKLIQLMPTPHVDRVEQGKRFGDVVDGKDVQATYKVGETVTATFHAANPRQNLRTQGTYVTVEAKQDSRLGAWKVVRNDADWSTKFRWMAGPEDPLDLGFGRKSKATLDWTVETDTPAGTYRLCYLGDHKVSKDEQTVPFKGCTSEFTVTA